MSRQSIRIKRSQCRSRQPPSAGGLTYAVARQYHLGMPGCQASSAMPGWRCWGSDSGSAGLGTRPYSARILRPPPLCTSRQPRPSTSPTSTATAATARAEIFLHIHQREREQQRQHTCPGYLDNNEQKHQHHPSPRPTANTPHEPNLSRLDSSTVDPGLARPSFSTSGIQSRAAADELGPHSAFLASWRANLRVNPEKPRAVPRPAAGTERVSIEGDSFSFSAYSPLTA